MKTCTKCGQTGEFNKNRSKKDGLKSWCKACEKAYREANREQSKAYREANREKIAEQNKAWYEANREKKAEQKKARYEANREKERERTKAWREANPGKQAELSKAWREANREKVKGHCRKRRARKAGAAGFHTKEQWQARIDYYGGKCYYCGNNEDITQEHRIPLSRGGSDWPANLVPACGSCNSRKHTKTETEYLKIKHGTRPSKQRQATLCSA